VDLEAFTIAVYCLVDELVQDVARHPDWRRVRRRGPTPTLADSEVITMVTVGEFLTERVWGMLLDRVPHDPALACVDSVPTPVCRFGRAWGCRRFRGEAAFGRDSGSRATIYGFRHHLRINAPGVVTALSVAPANVHDLALVPELVEGATGQVIGDRNYWDPTLTAELAPAGIMLLAPFKKRATDPTPAGSRLLGRVRWRIETVAAQLVERFRLKRIWARDAWHLTSRVLRKVLSHTIAVFLCLERGYPPLSFARLLD
jgi:hypothetical protein